MAIFPFSNAYVINKDAVAGSSFKAGMILMINSAGNVIPADPQTLSTKPIEQIQTLIIGFAAGDSNTTGNTIIVPDYIGSNYLDSNSNFVSISDREYVSVRRQLLDYADETVNDYYNINYSPVPKRTGIGVYSLSGDNYATDQFVPVLNGDFGIDGTVTQTINPGDLVTIGSGINAGKLVKVNSNSIGRDIIVVGIVEKFDTNTRLLYFRSAFYTIKFSSSSVVMALDAGNSYSFPNTGYIGTICGSANENGSFTLTAPVGHVFDKVLFASYGTPEGTCQLYTQGGCHSATSQSVVEGLLLGNNSVTLAANNGVFGDPCPGTVKRLYVQARFAPILAKDLSLFNNNGTLNNGVTYDTAGGGSWSLDGTNDYILIPNSSSVNPSDNFTVQFWFLPKNISVNKTFIAKYTSGTQGWVFNQNLNQISFDGRNFTADGYKSAISSVNLTLNKWFHIVGIKNGLNQYIYVNGIETGSTTWTTTGSMATSNPITTFYAGDYLQCNITDFRLYNRALSATEILAYYNNTKSRFGL